MIQSDLLPCPNCGALIGMPPCACGWAPPGRSTTSLPPLTPSQKYPGMTLEEFGVPLFEAIKAASGRVQALKTAHVYAKQGKFRMARLSVLESERLSRELQSHLLSPEISGEDTRRILALDASAPLPPDLPITATLQNPSANERAEARQGDHPIQKVLIPD